MESERPEAQDFSQMKLSDLIKFESDDDSEYVYEEINPLIAFWDDLNEYQSPESDGITNSNTNDELANEAEKTNVQPTDMNQDLINQKPVDDENENQESKTAIESEQNENLLVNDHANRCIAGKRKPESTCQRTDGCPKRMRAERAKSLPATPVTKENLKADLQNQSKTTDEI